MEKLVYIFVLLVGHPSNGDLVIVTEATRDAIACELRIDEERAKAHPTVAAYCLKSGSGLLLSPLKRAGS